MNESAPEPSADGLSGPDAEALLGAGKPRTVHARTILCREGQVTDCFFVVTRGKFSVAKRIGGKKHALSVLGPGSVLALMPALDGEPCAVSISALSDATVVAIPRERLLALLAHHGEADLHLANSLSLLAIRRLRGAIEELSRALYTMLRSPEHQGRIDALCLARIQAGSYGWLG
jgi:CRP-like cAMP-binding protein